MGYKILAQVPYLRPAARIVLAHHERWDGGGYPRRLKGEEIPLGARIFALADTYDAIISDRPYRKGQSPDAAFAGDPSLRRNPVRSEGHRGIRGAVPRVAKRNAPARHACSTSRTAIGAEGEP